MTHVLPQDGGGLTPAPEQAHTPQPPPAIPYHIYQNVVLAALNSGTAAGLGQPLVAAAAAATMWSEYRFWAIAEGGGGGGYQLAAAAAAA